MLTSADDPALFGVCSQQHMAVQIRQAPAVERNPETKKKIHINFLIADETSLITSLLPKMHATPVYRMGSV